jgi:gamma-glutamyltranspeptidase / glutathione hydrolase
VSVDPRLSEAIRSALGDAFPTVDTELVVYPTNYACPSAVLRVPNDGTHFGIADVMSPWSGAVAEDGH